MAITTPLTYNNTTTTSHTASSQSFTKIIARILPGLLIDGFSPFVIYTLCKHFLPVSDTFALSVGALVPLIRTGSSLLRERHINIVSTVTLISIVGSMVAALIGGSPQLLLIRESFVGGLLGVAFLVSLLFPRPLVFLFAQHMRAGNDPIERKAFDARWASPRQRFAFRLMSVVWGLGSLVELALRIVLVLTLPIPVVLGISTILFPAIYLTMMAWTIFYMRRISTNIVR